MKKSKIGLIRVISIRDEKLLNSHGRIIESAFPELEVISRCIEDQPKGIYDEETEKRAKPKILRLIEELQGEVEAIIISCAADPGVEEAKGIARVPIIGAGSSSASIASFYGRKVGVLNLREKTPSVFKEILGERLIGEEHPEGVENTLDLLTEWGRERALEAGRRLKDKGAQVIALACTGYSTIGLSPLLEKSLHIPVIDAVIASGAMALHALRRLKGWEG